MPDIFISYRRKESAADARALYERLRHEFGIGAVFIDLEGIEYGEDFVDTIEGQLEGCKVLLALIGPLWLSATDERGRRRIDDENDFVRIEVRAALQREVRVIPVLVDGATMPHVSELPADLVSLVRRQALELDYKRFDVDVRRLCDVLRRFVDAPAPAASPQPTRQRVPSQEPLAVPVAPPAAPAAPAATAAAPASVRWRRAGGIAALLAAAAGLVYVAAAPPPRATGTSAASVAPQPLVAADAPVLGRGTLTEQLERATAIVIIAGQDDLGTGTGFFVAPNLLVTNRHVIEGASGKRLFITSKALGALRRASVLGSTKDSEPGSPDLALLRMDEGSAAGTLPFAPNVGKLTPVVAAGFPGVVLQSDRSFQRLLKGELSAAPDLSITEGSVQSLQAGEGELMLIVHTAAVAKGMSGGPLVDACGRLVAINTFVNVDQSQAAKINYAIRTDAVARFLQSLGTTARSDPRPCTGKG